MATFPPSAFTIRRLLGQLYFTTETEWEYNGEAAPPLDPSKPKRTVEASGVSVRLFEALLNDTTRVILKEFVGDTEEARGLIGSFITKSLRNSEVGMHE